MIIFTISKLIEQEPNFDNIILDLYTRKIPPKKIQEYLPAIKKGTITIKDAVEHYRIQQKLPDTTSPLLKVIGKIYPYLSELFDDQLITPELALHVILQDKYQDICKAVKEANVPLTEKSFQKYQEVKTHIKNDEYLPRIFKTKKTSQELIQFLQLLNDTNVKPYPRKEHLFALFCTDRYSYQDFQDCIKEEIPLFVLDVLSTTFTPENFAFLKSLKKHKIPRNLLYPYFVGHLCGLTLEKLNALRSDGTLGDKLDELVIKSGL